MTNEQGMTTTTKKPLEWQYSRNQQIHDAVGAFDHVYEIRRRMTPPPNSRWIGDYKLLIDGIAKATSERVAALKKFAENVHQKAIE